MKAVTKSIITATIGLTAGVLIFLFLIQPALSRLSELSRNLQDKKQREITLEQQIRAYKTAQSDLSRADQKDKIFNSLVTKENLVQAVESLERGASVTGTDHTLDISEEAPAPTAAAKNKTAPVNVLINRAGLTEVVYRLSIKNDFIGTVQFLDFLEHLPQFTEITKINLSAETAEGSSGQNVVKTGQVLGSIDGVFVIKNEDTKDKR